MKKALKIIGIVLLVLVVFLIAAPFIFKGPIERAVKKSINNNINATVAWEDLDLSLFSSFPDAELQLENLSVINKEPFAGDTLATAEKLGLSMGIPQLFKGGDAPLSVNQLDLDNAYVNIKVDSLGNANYDIAKERKATPNQQDQSTQGGLSLDVQEYNIANSRINYLDEASKTFVRLKDFNHHGSGDFSAEEFTLKTTSETLISFTLDEENYLENNKLQLDADFKMNLAEQKFSFLENKALINKLPLTFDGFVKVNENNNEVDISFTTPSSDFKNFLAVIPETYAKNLDGVETSGDFKIDGKINGIIDEENIPKLDIAVTSNNAAFKYPDLPKQVRNINLDAVLKNQTGKIEDTYLNLDKLTFTIDQDVFSANGNFKNITENMLVNLVLKGTLNLANLEKAYPLELEQDLNGILKADLQTNFAMNDVENENYSRVKSQGTASISNFKYTSKEIPNPVLVDRANLSFNTSNVTLQEMQLKTGQTDAKISGTLDNLMGYLFSDQKLKGRFKVAANTFAINDFMIAQAEDTSVKENEETETSQQPKATQEEAIKIPSFLDARLDFTANKVIYDNLTLSNTKGAMAIKDETARLENVSADIFGGNISLNGNVSTKAAHPTFDMDLKLNRINIVDSFKELELLRNLAPIAKALKGDLNTTINLHGNLTKELTPILSSLAGDAFAKILDADIDTQQMPLLANLDSKLNFLNLDKLDLKDIETKVQFQDGQVNLQPFDFNIKDILITVNGSHSFDNQMNYEMALDLPAKYLGSEIGGGLANLTQTDLENTKVTLPVALSGSFSNPNVQLNIKQATQELSQQIIASQKDKIKDKATDKIKDILGGNKDDDATENQDGTVKDTSKTKDGRDKIKDAAEDILGGLFGKKKKDKQKQENN